MVKAFAAGGCRVLGGPSRAPFGNHKRTLPRPPTGGPHDRYRCPLGWARPMRIWS